MARHAPRPRKYELMIVVAPTVTEDGLPAVVERVSDLIEAQDGAIESINHDSPWGHRRLAYPIDNFRDAFYVLYYFHAVPRAISELDRELRLDNAIIRHLIVKFDPLAYRHISDEDDEDAVDVEDQPAAEADEEDDAAAASDSDDTNSDTPDTAVEESGDADDDSEDDDAVEDEDDEPDTDGGDSEEADDGEDDEKE
ncbi:hypothetical protein BH23CHL2_BH23CHL2_10160 [soil metagenome]